MNEKLPEDGFENDKEEVSRQVRLWSQKLNSMSFKDWKIHQMPKPWG